MSGWIEWAGGECPVPPETRVAVQFRFEPGVDQGNDRAVDLRWSHKGYDADIIAYRIVKEPQLANSQTQ